MQSAMRFVRARRLRRRLLQHRGGSDLSSSSHPAYWVTLGDFRIAGDMI